MSVRPTESNLRFNETLLYNYLLFLLFHLSHIVLDGKEPIKSAPQLLYSPTINNQTLSAKGDQVIGSKAPEQLLNGLCQSFVICQSPYHGSIIRWFSPVASHGMSYDGFLSKRICHNYFSNSGLSIRIKGCEVETCPVSPPDPSWGLAVFYDRLGSYYIHRIFWAFSLWTNADHKTHVNHVWIKESSWVTEVT